MTEFEGKLPIFSGFYSTWFDPDYVFDTGSIYEFLCIQLDRRLPFTPIQYVDTTLSTFLKEATHYCYERVKIKEYQDVVVKEAVRHVQKRLNLILPSDARVTIVKPLLQSPREYNFMNDSIYAMFQFDRYERFRSYIDDRLSDSNDMIRSVFERFLKDTFTTCDGFISFYSNELDVWQRKTNAFRSLDVIELWTVLSVLLETEHRCSCALTDLDYDVQNDMELRMYEEFTENQDVSEFFPDVLDVIESESERREAEILIENSDVYFELDKKLMKLLRKSKAEVEHDIDEEQ